LPIPDVIKSILVDDWENVTKNNTLVALPSRTPISQIMQEFYDAETSKRAPGNGSDILEETVKGVQMYADTAIGRILLYTQERAQYGAIYKRVHTKKDDPLYGKRMSEIYGGEHLLRQLGRSLFHFLFSRDQC
jgi:mortality factor 4-like protein 1